MIRLCLLSTVWPILTAAVPAGAIHGAAAVQGTGTGQHETSFIDRAFILECERRSDIESLAQEMERRGGTIRHNFTSDTFLGLSVQLPGGDGSQAGNFSAEMEMRSGVKNVWPIATVTLPKNVTTEVAELQKDPKRRNLQGFGARDTGDKTPWNHLMTQVDKLHAKGYTGNGIRIGVVDTGVNYNVPALGGCFGSGCRVAFGGAFDGVNMESDPMDFHGHGTIVASILAGYSKEHGFVGVAPNATIGAYKVFNIGGIAAYGEDNIMAAWLQAEKDQMQVIVSSYGIQGGNWAQRPAALVVSRLVAKGIACVAGVGNERQWGLFNVMNPSSGRGVISVNSFKRDGALADLSAAGPSPELDIKPNIGAPGELVPVAYKDGSFGNDSGTSFAGPLVAGIIALVAEARGTFDPALIESLLMSTATPQGQPFSVAYQGGGLVQAWDAAHATTIAHPASLAFNDTDHRVPTLSLSITNTAKSEVQYQLSNVPAEIVYTLDENGRKATASIPIETTKNSDLIKLSQSSFTLSPGQKISVDISALDPEGVEVKRLPVWSGYVKIQEVGSANKSLTVPYLGLAGSLRSMTVMENGGYVAIRNMNRPAVLRFTKIWPASVVVPDPQSLNSVPGRIEGFEWPANTNHGNPYAFFNLAIGTPQIEVYIVPLDICKEKTNNLTSLDISRACVPESSLSEVGGIKSLGLIPNYAHQYRGRGEHENGFEFTGLLESGQYAPPGRYKFVARALAVLGDADNAEHWQVQETPEFTFGYESNLIDPR